MANMQKIGTHQTKHKKIDGLVTVTYWYTQVFTYDLNKGIVTLDTGYYETNTTKLRMNQSLNVYGLPLRVFTSKGILKVHNYLTGEEWEFTKVIAFQIDYDDFNKPRFLYKGVKVLG